MPNKHSVKVLVKFPAFSAGTPGISIFKGAIKKALNEGAGFANDSVVVRISTNQICKYADVEVQLSGSTKNPDTRVFKETITAAMGSVGFEEKILNVSFFEGTQKI